MIIPPEVMSDEHMKILRENGICIVVASDPSKVKFVDPIPAISCRTQIEKAAIRMSRILINGAWHDYNASGVISRETVLRIWTDALVAGTELDVRGTREEQEQKIIDEARRQELYRIGQEEARAERAKKKAEKLAASKSESKLPKTP